MRDLSGYNLGSSSEIDNGYPYQKVTPVSYKYNKYIFSGLMNSDRAIKTF